VGAGPLSGFFIFFVNYVDNACDVIYCKNTLTVTNQGRRMKKYCTWGGVTASGFVAVPRAFLQNYKKLGLTHSDAMLVIEIMSYCWCDGSEHLPFPQIANLAENLGLHERNIRNGLNKLRNAGLLKTTRRMHNLEYDFSGLFSKLAEIVDNSKKAKHPITISHNTSATAHMRLRLKPRQGPLPEPTFDGVIPAPHRAPATGVIITHKEEHEKESLRDSCEASSTPTLLDAEEPYPTRTTREKSSSKKAETTSASEGLEKAKKILDKYAARPVPDRVPIKQSGGKKFVFDADKPLTEYNAHDVIAAYRVCWRDSMDCAPPAFTTKDMALAKKLLLEYGAEYVLSYLVFCFRNWQKLAKRLSLVSDPSFSVLYGYRNSLSALHRDPSRMESEKWGSKYNNKDVSDFDLE